MNIEIISSENLIIGIAQDAIRSRLGKLAAHIVVALIALVVIGGATRVMEAGLACPDWPLCYGSVFPKTQMNLKVFLEWFHRLDAFFVGIAILFQFLIALIFKSSLPRWLPWLNSFIVLLIALQASLGALTVINLLPSHIVMSHLLLGLILIVLMSGLAERLLSPNGIEPPLWWKLLSGTSLVAVLLQTMIGSRIATTWSAQRCISNGINCQLLDLHRLSAFSVGLCVFGLFLTAVCVGGWFRSQWPFLLLVSSLIIFQILVGFVSVHFNLSHPSLRVLHQLLAALLVAFLASLCCRKRTLSVPGYSGNTGETSFEVCHG